MSKDFDALKNFVDEWRGKPGFDIDPTGTCIFEADVIYRNGGKSVTQSTKVMMIRNGYDDGKIGLGEKGRLSSDKFHLDFTPTFQDYEYDEENKSLVVTGKSDKMQGKYAVTIQPA